MNLPLLPLRLALMVSAAMSAATFVMAADDFGDRSTAIAPTEKIALFNGRNLDGFYTWLKDAKYDDPRQVFGVENGMLHVTGDGLGYLATRRSYRDYHLVIEFRWGPKTWGKRVDRARDSGLIVHCTGPDGSLGGVFMSGVEAQIIEGGVGDFIVCAGKRPDGTKIPVTLDCFVSPDRDGEPVWTPGGQRKTFSDTKRVNWFGRDPDWADKRDFRGAKDVESPGQGWTRLEVICQGDRIENRVNGVKVNEGFDARPSFGPILLQTELAEIFVRRWELWPLGQGPTDRLQP